MRLIGEPTSPVTALVLTAAGIAYLAIAGYDLATGQIEQAFENTVCALAWSLVSWFLVERPTP